VADLAGIVGRALEARGQGHAAASALGVTPPAWSRLIARLRGAGVARTITLVDPRRAGSPCEGVSLVKLRGYSHAAMDSFEAACRNDPAVHRAVRVTGRFDYQLASCHPDPRAAERWRRGLEARPEVLRVDQRLVRTVLGHGLYGVPLGGLRGTTPDADRPAESVFCGDPRHV
jgi:DNA-binding Lrp family transcriptional regulator